MVLFDAKKIADRLEQSIRDFMAKSGASVTNSHLGIVQIGDNPSSTKFVTLKKKFCDSFGIPCHVYSISESFSDNEILSYVRDIFNDVRVGGGLVQLPLPRKSLGSVLELIPLNKDVDCISPACEQQFYSGNFSRLSPVVRAFTSFVDTLGGLRDKHVVIIGNGNLVGKPIGFYAKSLGARVSIVDNYCRGTKLEGDLFILSVGSPNLVSGNDLPLGGNVIDFGSSVVDGKTVGDLDRSSAIDHLGLISTSPGGMGPLVVRFLVMNYLGI